MKLAPSRRPLLLRAFSLIELLVVIAIIAIVVSLVVPAIGSARKSAREADTRTLIGSLSQACSQFILDNRRNPGYFSAREMGSAENATRGLSAMQNVLLDLSGGIVSAGGINVGPTAANTVQVSPELIGSTSGASKSYFTAKGRSYQLQDGVNPEGGSRIANAENMRLPDLVDAEGTPILIWTVDETCTKAPTNDAAGLAVMAQQSSANLSRFYLNSNATYLTTSSANPVGKRRIPQAESGFAGGASLIGGAAPAAAVNNLAALLASPNAPHPFTDTTPANMIFPTAPRGQFIIHAAGRDGMYFGSKDKGGSSAVGGFVFYGQNFKPVAEDILKSFDDIVTAGN